MSRPQTLKCSQATKDALITGSYVKYDGSAFAVTNFVNDSAYATGTSRNIVENYLSENSAVTSLTQNQWAVVSGTWTNSLLKGTQLTTDAAGKITYGGPLPAILWLSCAISMGPVSGGSDVDLHMAMFKNGTKIASTELVFAASQARTQSTQLQGFVSVANGDYIQVKIMNADSNTDSTVGHANCMVLVTALA